jgi:hypothetical protein
MIGSGVRKLTPERFMHNAHKELREFGGSRYRLSCSFDALGVGLPAFLHVFRRQRALIDRDDQLVNLPVKGRGILIVMVVLSAPCGNLR